VLQLLSLKIEKFAEFRRNKDKWISQQDHHIDQYKENMQFHLSSFPILRSEAREIKNAKPPHWQSRERIGQLRTGDREH